ncbi:MAG TPA: Uma2 family endonuclease [Candidatus Limnocylindrales bacterium]|nr:Uma2 family endonuclease [Candidatus Limnocylindrales bacterium]
METAFRSEQKFTQAEFFKWLAARPSSDIHHYELLDRHIVMTPPAGYPHSMIGVRISAALLQHVRTLRLGLVSDATAGYELPSGDTVEPDVSFVTADTLKAGRKPEPGSFFRIVPDLVVEIVSKTGARRDTVEKRRIYEKNGVAEYWLIYPKTRHVSVLRLVDGRFTSPLDIVSGSVRSSVLSDFEIPLAEIFADCG